MLQPLTLVSPSQRAASPAWSPPSSTAVLPPQHRQAFNVSGAGLPLAQSRGGPITAAGAGSAGCGSDRSGLPLAQQCGGPITAAGAGSAGCGSDQRSDGAGPRPKKMRLLTPSGELVVLDTAATSGGPMSPAGGSCDVEQEGGAPQVPLCRLSAACFPTVGGVAAEGAGGPSQQPLGGLAEVLDAAQRASGEEAPSAAAAQAGLEEGDDDLALEILLRKAAVMTGMPKEAPALLRAVAEWFDLWEGKMEEVYATMGVNVYRGRWRSNLQKAVDRQRGGTCLLLLRMIGLLLE